MEWNSSFQPSALNILFLHFYLTVSVFMNEFRHPTCPIRTLLSFTGLLSRKLKKNTSPVRFSAPHRCLASTLASQIPWFVSMHSYTSISAQQTEDNWGTMVPSHPSRGICKTHTHTHDSVLSCCLQSTSHWCWFCQERFDYDSTSGWKVKFKKSCAGMTWAPLLFLHFTIELEIPCLGRPLARLSKLMVGAARSLMFVSWSSMVNSNLCESLEILR